MRSGGLRLGPNASVKNCLSISRATNCFVWCCSLEDGAGRSAATAFPGCDSSFEFRDPHAMMHWLRDLILGTVTVEHFAPDAQSMLRSASLRQLASIELIPTCRRVRYCPNKRTVIRHSEITDDYEQDLPRPVRRLFVKHSQFAPQREFRFAFFFCHPTFGELAVQHDPLDVPTTPLAPSSALPVPSPLLGTR